MRSKVLIGVAAVVVVLVGVGVWAFWPGGTTPVTEEDAVEDFRSRDTAAADTAQESADVELPEPGVYTFAATGSEDVKLGPLPTETRPFPETVTGVVVAAGDDCFTLTVNLFAEHTEDTTYCVDGDTLRIDEHRKHQKIGPLSPEATMTCDPDVLVDRAESPLELSCSLSMSGGPVSVTATLAGTSERGDAVTPLPIGGTDVDAWPVTVTHTVTGDLTGTWSERLWLDASTWMPLRIERDLELSGLATFTEHSTLELTGLEPSS